MKNMDFLKSWQYAHRGLFDNKQQIPENSLKAFKKALENNYAIELDIQAISDNTFVCFHDSNLKRMTNLDSKLYNYNYEQLKEIKLLDSNEEIPKFIDVLNVVSGKVPLLIEIKSHQNYKKHLNNLVLILDQYKGNYAVFSFDPKIVKWFKKYRPNYIRGQITSYFHENNKMPKLIKYLMKTLFFNKFTKPDFISYNIDNLPNKYANKFKNQNNKVVFGYTARTQDQYDAILNNYDNVVFESFRPKKNT